MSSARKFKRRPLPPQPKLPTPYPLMSIVEDCLREVQIYKETSLGPTSVDVSYRSGVSPVSFKEVERQLLDSSFARHMQRIAEVLNLSPSERELVNLVRKLSHATGMPAAQVAESIAIAAECGLPFATIVANIKHGWGLADA